VNQPSVVSIDPSPTTDSSLTWKEVLSGEKESEYFVKLLKVIAAERTRGKLIYPANSEIFNALALTPFNLAKVIIIGQDPYHGPNQAHGLCFSVRQGVPPPPSLINIFKELSDDLGVKVPAHGCLTPWATQGVLLLNAVLTVENGNPQSHAGLGWERFTDRIIKELNDRKTGLVFLLWGSHAQKKCEQIDPNRHVILKAPHPSPLSAHRGFFGCKHFSKTNQILREQGITPIEWDLA